MKVAGPRPFSFSSQACELCSASHLWCPHFACTSSSISHSDMNCWGTLSVSLSQDICALSLSNSAQLCTLKTLWMCLLIGEGVLQRELHTIWPRGLLSCGLLSSRKHLCCASTCALQEHTRLNVQTFNSRLNAQTFVLLFLTFDSFTLGIQPFLDGDLKHEREKFLGLLKKHSAFRNLSLSTKKSHLLLPSPLSILRIK